MGKDNKGLVRHAHRAYNEKWGYVWGTFGQVLTNVILNQKAKQYPVGVGRYITFIRNNWLGKRTADCAGLIKGYIWENENTGKVVYNNNTDLNANMMYAQAKEKGPISTMPEIEGLAVWRKGHIGVYIGNGWVIEAQGTTIGVRKNKLKDRNFTHWLKVPNINYKEKEIVNIDLLGHKIEVEGYLKDGVNYMVVGESEIPVRDVFEAMGLYVSWGNGVVVSLEEPSEGADIVLRYERLLRNGSRGEDVKQLQRRLLQLGYNPNGIDGIFGAGTLRAVREFQADNYISVDGIVGSDTVWALNNPKKKVETPKHYKYYKSRNSHVVEVNPMDLKISVQDKTPTRVGLKNFITSGYQWHLPNGVTYPLGILASGNRGISNRQPHGKPAGTLLVYRDGSVDVKDILNLNRESMVRFAVSGCSILPEVKMQSAGFVGVYSDIARKTYRPMAGYRKRDNKVLLVFANCDIYEGKRIMAKLGCDKAITLDGGGSATLKVDGKAIRASSRRLYSLITW